MTQPAQLAALNFEQLGLLRDVLTLIGRIRAIEEPIASPEGLRRTSRSRRDRRRRNWRLVR
jgi:hypothetical protein